MALTCRVELEWADGVYSFALPIKYIEELETISPNPTTGKKGIGISAIWTRLMGSSWYLADIMNIIRLGLIGGGMQPVEAMRLVKTYCEGCPISPLQPGANNPLTVAQTVLAAAVIGSSLDSPANEDKDEETSEPGESETPKS